MVAKICIINYFKIELLEVYLIKKKIKNKKFKFTYKKDTKDLHLIMIAK